MSLDFALDRDVEGKKRIVGFDRFEPVCFAVDIPAILHSGQRFGVFAFSCLVDFGPIYIFVL